MQWYRRSSLCVNLCFASAEALENVLKQTAHAACDPVDPVFVPEDDDRLLNIGEFVGVVLGVIVCVDGLGGGTGLADDKDETRLLLLFVFKEEWLRFVDPIGQGELGREIETGRGLVGRAMVVEGVKNGDGGGGI